MSSLKLKGGGSYDRLQVALPEVWHGSRDRHLIEAGSKVAGAVSKRPFRQPHVDPKWSEVGKQERLQQ